MSRKKNKGGRRRQHERDRIATDAQEAVREHDLAAATAAPPEIVPAPVATVEAAPAPPLSEPPPAPSAPAHVAEIKSEPAPSERSESRGRTERKRKSKPPETKTTRTTRPPATRTEAPPQPPGAPPKTSLHETRGIPASRVEPPPPEAPPTSRTRKYIDKAGGTLADFVSATRSFLKNFTAPAPPEVRITLPKDGDIRLFKLSGELDERTILQASTWMLFVQAMKADADIVLTIDSPGGSVTAGLSLVDVMLKATCRVRTHCPRQALGVASLILAAGSKGYRTIAPAALIGVPGSPLAGEGRTTASVSPRVVEAFAKATGKSEDEIRKEVLKLKTVTPKLAVKYGIADAVAKA